jgi:putative SbcD/Mre11-related phosphoesterase
MQVHRDWLLTPQRAAVHLPSATAVLSDLHLGYELARQRRGEAVPGGSLDEAIAALTALASAHLVRRLVLAGDLVEDRTGVDRLGTFIAWLQTAGVELMAVVPGNHDQGLSGSFAGPPVVSTSLDLGGWLVVHGHGRLPPGRAVLGHFHPCVRLGRRVAAPCFLIGRRRIVLPAFSPDAAGVNVLKLRQWRAYRCAAIAGDRVLDFGPVGELARRVRTPLVHGLRPGKQYSRDTASPRR